MLVKYALRAAPFPFISKSPSSFCSPFFSAHRRSDRLVSRLHVCCFPLLPWMSAIRFCSSLRLLLRSLEPVFCSLLSLQQTQFSFVRSVQSEAWWRFSRRRTAAMYRTFQSLLSDCASFQSSIDRILRQHLVSVAILCADRGCCRHLTLLLVQAGLFLASMFASMVSSHTYARSVHRAACRPAGRVT
jgi:hypothetical protein